MQILNFSRGKRQFNLFLSVLLIIFGLFNGIQSVYAFVGVEIHGSNSENFSLENKIYSFNLDIGSTTYDKFAISNFFDTDLYVEVKPVDSVESDNIVDGISCANWMSVAESLIIPANSIQEIPFSIQIPSSSEDIFLDISSGKTCNTGFQVSFGTSDLENLDSIYAYLVDVNISLNDWPNSEINEFEEIYNYEEENFFMKYIKLLTSYVEGYNGLFDTNVYLSEEVFDEDLVIGEATSIEDTFVSEIENLSFEEYVEVQDVDEVEIIEDTDVEVQDVDEVEIIEDTDVEVQDVDEVEIIEDTDVEVQDVDEVEIIEDTDVEVQDVDEVEKVFSPPKGYESLGISELVFSTDGNDENIQSFLTGVEIYNNDDNSGYNLNPYVLFVEGQEYPLKGYVRAESYRMFDVNNLLDDNSFLITLGYYEDENFIFIESIAYDPEGFFSNEDDVAIGSNNEDFLCEEVVQGEGGTDVEVEEVVQGEGGTDVEVEEVVQGEGGTDVEVEEVVQGEGGTDVEVEEVVQGEGGTDVEVEEVVQGEGGTDVEVEEVVQGEGGTDVEVEEVVQGEGGTDVEVEEVVQGEGGTDVEVEEVVQGEEVGVELEKSVFRDDSKEEDVVEEDVVVEDVVEEDVVEEDVVVAQCISSTDSENSVASNSVINIEVLDQASIEKISYRFTYEGNIYGSLSKMGVLEAYAINRLQQKGYSVLNNEGSEQSVIERITVEIEGDDSTWAFLFHPTPGIKNNFVNDAPLVSVSLESTKDLGDSYYLTFLVDYAYDPDGDPITAEWSMLDGKFEYIDDKRIGLLLKDSKSVDLTYKVSDYLGASSVVNIAFDYNESFDFSDNSIASFIDFESLQDKGKLPDKMKDLLDSGSKGYLVDISDPKFNIPDISISAIDEYYRISLPLVNFKYLTRNSVNAPTGSVLIDQVAVDGKALPYERAFPFFVNLIEIEGSLKKDGIMVYSLDQALGSKPDEIQPEFILLIPGGTPPGDLVVSVTYLFH